MSELLVNDVAVTSCYFNQSAVSSIYVNNVKVFPASYSWPGIGKATMEDVHLLCQAKANGEITEWPSDLQVGKNIGSYKVNGDIFYSLVFAQGGCRILGIDSDGPNTITFYSIYASSSFASTYGCKTIEEVREFCRTAFPQDPTNPWGKYIKPIKRKWYNKTASGYAYEDTIDYYWPLSINDLTLHDTGELSEFRTEGYPRFLEATNRRCSGGVGTLERYATGSRNQDNPAYLYDINTQGNLNTAGSSANSLSTSRGIPFAWVIG